MAWYRSGALYAGFATSVKAKDLAKISATYGTQSTGVEGTKSNYAAIPGINFGWSMLWPFALPRRRTEYVNAEKGVRWQSFFEENLPPAGRVEAAWTFSSAHVAGSTNKRLPMSSIRFAPPVDLTNTAPAGKIVQIGIGIDRQAGSSATTMKSLIVEVSFDDGYSWKKVTLRGAGDARTAVVAHRATAGFVSLRVTGADTAGNTVQQTVVRAYRIA